MRVTIVSMILALLAWSPSLWAWNENVHEYRLDNGLRLLVKEDHRAPVVVSQIWYKVGSAYEPAGLTGISHVLEHMMFKGTHKHGPGEFSRIIAANGGQENAGTSKDYTFYYQKLAADKLALSLELEADRMQNLLLLPTEFAKEINVVKEERRMRIEAQPQMVTYERFNAMAHLAHPYHHMTVGWMNDLDHMTIDDVKSWYHTWYAPNNAIVIVVGDVKPKQVLQWVTQYFGALKSVELPTLKVYKEPVQLGPRQLTVKIPAQVPWLIMAYNVPSAKTAEVTWEPYALDMLAAILGYGNSARLEKGLLRGQQIASNVSVNYDAFSLFDDLLSIEATPAQTHSVAELKQAILTAVSQLQQQPVAQQELERIKNQVVAERVYARDSMYYQGMLLGHMVVLDLPWTLADDYVEHLKQVTAAQVQAVARKYLQPDYLTTAELIPTALAKGVSS